MVKERSPILFSDLEVNSKRSREETRETREVIFRRVSEEDLARLTDHQLSALNLIFPPEGKGLTLERAGKQSGNVTRETIRQARNAGIRKLERLQRGESATKRKGTSKLKMDPNTKELLLQNRDLSMGGLHELLGHSTPIIRRWLDEADMPRRKIGRPRKSGVSSQQNNPPIPY